MEVRGAKEGGGERIPRVGENRRADVTQARSSSSQTPTRHDKQYYSQSRSMVSDPDRPPIHQASPPCGRTLSVALGPFLDTWPRTWRGGGVIPSTPLKGIYSAFCAPCPPHHHQVITGQDICLSPYSFGQGAVCFGSILSFFSPSERIHTWVRVRVPPPPEVAPRSFRMKLVRANDIGGGGILS